MSAVPHVEPCAPKPPAAPRPAALTRSDVLLLGQRGGPWQFVPLAIAALRVEPRDEHMRLLLAAAYARLGLKTPASDQLARINASMPAIAALRSSIERLPGDLLQVQTRIRMAQGNLRALAARGLRFDSEFAQWAVATQGEEWFRCADGNLVRRAAGADGDREWIKFADDAAAARGSVSGLGPAAGKKMPPVYFEGLDPPWLLLRVCSELPRQTDGYWPPVVVMVEDRQALIDGLACADLRALLSEDRLDLVVGPGANEKLKTRLQARFTCDLGRLALVSGSRKPDPSNWPGEVLRQALDQQQRTAERCIRAVHERYAARDPAWWARRFAQANDRTGGPLRVLIPTTRFSTYVQHASRDIAAAFESAGCQARVLIEPDDSTTLAAWAYSQAIEEFDPDLILLLNYTRSHVAGMVPANVPFVCWVQDAMGHLFNAEVGKQQGALDFVVGHPHEALFKHFEFSAQRILPAPVLASAAKFQGRHPSAALLKLHECEIACATHQSQPAELYAAQLIDQHPLPAGKQLIQTLLPVVRSICEEAAEIRSLARFRDAAKDALTDCGLPVSEGSIATTVHQICHPLADRFLRSQALEWAATVARARGWRLHLYGRGWEKHPTLAPFARGELAHGDELHASFQAARVHLHASINPYLHQRVMECALAGGLPLVRFKRDDLALVEAHTHARCADHALAPAACPADAAEAMTLVAQYQRLGIPYAATDGYDPDPARNPCNPWATQPAEVAWLLGDLTQTTFASCEQLEQLVENAVSRLRWRANLSEGIAGRVRRHLTYESIAGRIIEMVTAGLANHPGVTPDHPV